MNYANRTISTNCIFNILYVLNKTNIKNMLHVYFT